jgi:hypothetical protein
LRENQRCTADYNDFLDLIREDMLVVHEKESPGDQHSSLVLQKSLSESAITAHLGNPRRKSCRDVLRRLGDIKPRYDQEGNLTRRNTLEPTSPIAQHHHVWPKPEGAANKTMLCRGLTIG